MPLDIIDLCDSDDENAKKGCGGSMSSNQSSNDSFISITSKDDNVKKGCGGSGPSNQSSDDESIISISSTEEHVAKKSSSAAIKTFNRQELKPPSRRHRRRGVGCRLEEGERIVWATEIETGSAHQAIILHPQPDPQGNTENVHGMVCIQWLNTNVVTWIARSNIRSQICGENGAVGKSEQPSDCIDTEDEDGGDEKMGEAFTKRHKLPTRKRTATNRYCDTIEKTPQLACERECQPLEQGKKKVATRRRTTCCTNVESIAKAKTNRRNELPANVRAAIAVVHARMASVQMTSNDESNFDGEWWRKTPATTERHRQEEIQGEQSVPVSLVSFFDDDQSVSSSVTLELPESDIHLASEHSDSYEGERDDDNVRAVTPQLKCHVCASHVHHHNQIDQLLGDLRAIANEQVDGRFWVEFVTFVTRFKVLLQGLEDDSCDGTSIFYHTCERNEAPNPIFTVAKLVQLFHVLCQIIATLIATASNQSTVKDTNKALLQLLFRPWRKEATKKTSISPKDCGVILQILRIATFEIINSREDFEPAENLDQLLGVTFGLQLLQTMAKNIYSDSKTELHNFLDRPLESYKTCIRRNCQVKHGPLTVCNVCGVRFHKSCLGANENSDVKENCCPSCKASAQLVEAARTSNLSDIYSLVVEKGASPLQPFLSETAGNETALHVAIRSNNYDLASMLLFGSHLLLNCDDSLLVWGLPKIAWGRGDKLHTPFESGLNTIKTNMNVRPPVEILLLLCGRGAQEIPEDIQKELQKRQGMMLVMNELESKQALLKSDISLGLEPFAVPVVSNSVTPSFMYVSKIFESRGTAIRWFDCRCGKGKQLMPFEGDCAAHSLKVLHRNQSLPSSWKSYCNYLCECRGKQLRVVPNGGKCKCQLAEDGVHHGLEVFETSDNRGFGVRVRKGVRIKKHEILCHYAGEIITSKEAKRRDQEYAKSHEGSYLLDMDEKGLYCIDATNFRSVAAFINHSCSEPNCQLFRALGNHLDANFPYLGLRAKENIGELTELTFNYGEKPTGFCLNCKGVHCLCKQCKEMEHRT